jgi:hypothetical protein
MFLCLYIARSCICVIFRHIVEPAKFHFNLTVIFKDRLNENEEIAHLRAILAAKKQSQMEAQVVYPF